MPHPEGSQNRALFDSSSTDGAKCALVPLCFVKFVIQAALITPYIIDA